MSYSPVLSSLHMANNAAVAKFAQRQIAPVLLPRDRQHGGASQANRRIFAHKILKLAALPWLSARQLGGNMCKNCQPRQL